MSAGYVLATKQFHTLPSPLTVVRPPGQMNLPLRLVLVNQNTCLSEVHTERFDQMNEAQPSSSSLSAMQALRERIERDAPWLQVLDLVEFASPLVRVKDTVNGIIVGFSSEVDYITYVGMMSRSGGKSHA